MTRKVFNVEGGKHSSAAFAAFENRAYGSVVASLASFVVSAGTGMNVSISPGDAIISVDANTAKRVQSDATETVAVSSASTSFNRIDTVVGYFDTGVAATQSVIDNTNNMFKFAVVAGTAASTPAAPTPAAIQSAIGAGKPYMVLYNVTVPSNATNLTAATFTDMRKVITVIDGAALKALSVGNGAIANGSVTNSKLSQTAGEIAGAYLAWTPSITGITIGNGTVSAKYSIIGKTVHCRFHILFGTTTVINGDIAISNPVTAATNSGTGNITPRGSFIAFNGGTLFTGIIANTSTTTSNIRFIKTDGPVAALLTAPNSSTPFASAAGCEIGGEFTYEKA